MSRPDDKYVQAAYRADPERYIEETRAVRESERRKINPLAED